VRVHRLCPIRNLTFQRNRCRLAVAVLVLCIPAFGRDRAWAAKGKGCHCERPSKLYPRLQCLMVVDTSYRISLSALDKGFDLYMHFDRILMKRMLDIDNAIPMCTRAIHLCTGSGVSVLSLVAPVIKHLMGRRLRHRMVLHAGSDTEINQQMELYGLQKNNIPSILGGSFTLSDFDVWLKERKQFERRRAIAEQEREPN